MPEPKDSWDAQHSPNKITTVESAQSCSEESKQAFMNKGAVPQGTKDEKKKSRSSWKRTFNPAAKDSNYLGKIARMRAAKKAEKVKMTK